MRVRGCEALSKIRETLDVEFVGGRRLYDEGETLTGQVTATHYRVEGVKSGISVVWKTMG